MEILGLAIIVILLALGLLFAVVVLFQESPRTGGRIAQSEFATNWVNTMLGTTTDCTPASGVGSKRMSNLLIDCAKTGGRALCPNGQTVCERAEDILRQMLDATFGTEKRDYIFTITGTTEIETMFSGDNALRGCFREDGKCCLWDIEANAEYKVPLGTGPALEPVLKICK